MTHVSSPVILSPFHLLAFIGCLVHQQCTSTPSTGTSILATSPPVLCCDRYALKAAPRTSSPREKPPALPFEHSCSHWPLPCTAPNLLAPCTAPCDAPSPVHRMRQSEAAIYREDSAAAHNLLTPCTAPCDAPSPVHLLRQSLRQLISPVKILSRCPHDPPNMTSVPFEVFSKTTCEAPYQG